MNPIQKLKYVADGPVSLRGFVACALLTLMVGVVIYLAVFIPIVLYPVSSLLSGMLVGLEVLGLYFYAVGGK